MLHGLEKSGGVFFAVLRTGLVLETGSGESRREHFCGSIRRIDKDFSKVDE